MMNKMTKIMFLLMSMFSVLISISSNSWFIVWMGMEMNLMSFMPLMMNSENISSKESMMTYFMTQTIASMLLMMSIVMMMWKSSINENELFNNKEMMMLLSLMMKSGTSPLHFWLPKTMEGLKWSSCLMLMTLQKMIPLMLLTKVIKINTFSMTVVMTSMIVGAIGGLNQTSLRKLMAYSSISNNGWMISAMMISEKTWIIYFMMYSMMITVMTMSMMKYKNYHMNQLMSMNEPLKTKMMLLMNMMSISGLPPMMGFMPKLMVIKANIINMEMMTMLTAMMAALITIYYYLRLMLSMMLMTKYSPKWNTKIFKKKNYKLMMTSMMSIIGLTMITLMYTIY
uniref:NADH-ubiquinone oxidoreductase chain 2 n=1 Tax=Cryptophyllium tibetense TaxID=2021296 RepID=A0A343KJT8_9NEOP|nr:NADH dehydrogenase subunit 2 [Cryptophyllium tibetense]